MTVIENEHSNCVKMVSCKVMTIDSQNICGIMGHWGTPRGLGLLGRHWGHQGVGVSGVYWGLARSVGTQGPAGV